MKTHACVGDLGRVQGTQKDSYRSYAKDIIFRKSKHIHKKGKHLLFLYRKSESKEQLSKDTLNSSHQVGLTILFGFRKLSPKFNRKLEHVSPSSSATDKCYFLPNNKEPINHGAELGDFRIRRTSTGHVLSFSLWKTAFAFLRGSPGSDLQLSDFTPACPIPSELGAKQPVLVDILEAGVCKSCKVWVQENV